MNLLPSHFHCCYTILVKYLVKQTPVFNQPPSFIINVGSTIHLYITYIYMYTIITIIIITIMFIIDHHTIINIIVLRSWYYFE